MNVKFQLLTSRAAGNIKAMANTMLNTNRQDFLSAQKAIIEENVKSRLYHPLVNDYVDRSRTSSKYTGVLAKIKSNITSGVALAGDSLTVWTGDTKLLDAKDPLMTSMKASQGGRNTVRTITKPTVRLWRILDTGSIAHKIPIMPKSKPLRFFWKLRGIMITTYQVNHPGTTGRSYWFKNRSRIAGRQLLWEGDKKLRPALKRIMAAHVKKYSG